MNLSKLARMITQLDNDHMFNIPALIPPVLFSNFVKNKTYKKYLQLRFYFIHIRYNKCNLNVQILNKM